MPSHPRRRARLLAVLLVTVPLLGACSGDDDPPTHPRPTTTAPRTTLSPEQRDEQALRQLTEEWFEAVRRIFVDGEDPALADEYLTGDYLDEFRQHVAENAASGQITERDPEGRSRTIVEDISITGNEAEITECVVDADVLKDAETGEVINDDVAARRFRTIAVRVESGWRLSNRATESRTEGSETCAG